jgi:hypothetical protein
MSCWLTHKFFQVNFKREPGACNPSYSGGRDQEDRGLKPAQAKSSRDPISKKKNYHEKGLVEWLKV